MATVSYETCPTSAPFFGFMGVTAALCFASKCHEIFTFEHVMMDMSWYFVLRKYLLCVLIV